MNIIGTYHIYYSIHIYLIYFRIQINYSKFVRIYANLFKFNRVCEFCSDCANLFGFCILCEFCSDCANFFPIVRICLDFVYCANFVRIVRIFFQLCEFVWILYTLRILFRLNEFCVNCENCAKSCSNFRTQKEQNKEQGPVRFFCANFLFILKE